MSTFFAFLIVAALLWYVTRAFRNVFGAIVPRSRPSIHFEGNGSFSLEAVGESKYQPALRAVCGPGEVRHECVAVLVLEDTNAYDNQAVMVTIDESCVGYLSRENARRYRRKYKHHGTFLGVCSALIMGGGKGRENVGVWLDVPI
jgi:hypothetical protein